MPEELKLLPCPACGGQAKMFIYFDPHKHAYEHRTDIVLCHAECTNLDCHLEGPLRSTKDDATTAWNALPRALTWTTEPPKVAGHYWCRYKSEGQESWSVAYVPAVTDWDKRDMEEHDRLEWAGPIPEPQEPES